MATVASVQSGWDGVTSRQARGCEVLQISTTPAAILAQTSGGDGFDQLSTAANVIEFAVPQLLDSDDVVGAAISGGDANIAAVGAWRSASSPTPKVKVQFQNIGANNANVTANPALIDILVARR